MKEGSVSSVEPQVGIPRKRRVADDIIVMDEGGGVRRRLERMSMAVDDDGVAKKSRLMSDRGDGN